MRTLTGLLCFLALAACTRVGGAGGLDGSGRHPGTVLDTVRVALPGNINTMNPLLTTQQVETVTEVFAFDPLIATDPEGHDVPMLAAVVPTLQNGGIGKDGLTITYHLRHNVVWQDGAPFSSGDVAFSYHAIMNPNNPVATRHGYDDIAQLQTPDKYTVVIRLKKPFSPFVHTFFAHSDAPYEIIPEHLLAKYKSLVNIPFNGQPIGTGPYKVVRWLRGDRIEYEANDRYFLGKPKLRKVVVRFIADENTIVNEMKAHEIDWYLQATPRSYPELKTVPNVSIRLVPFNGVDFIIFNTTKAPFDDARVRRAVGLTIDKHRLVEDATFGTAIPATEDIPSFMWAFDPTAGTSARDLPQAKGLLDAAGWHAGPDGIRTKNGQRLTMTLAYRTESVTDRERGVLLVQMLKDGGIEAELKSYTTGLLYGPASDNGILASGRFEAGIETWYAGVDPDDSSQLLCSERAPVGFNWSRYCSPEMDAAQNVALSHYDIPTRKRAYSTIQHILARDAPMVYLWWPRQIQAVNVDLKNFRPNGIADDWNSWEWSI